MDLISMASIWNASWTYDILIGVALDKTALCLFDRNKELCDSIHNDAAPNAVVT
jgi:hypothetical protein